MSIEVSIGLCVKDSEKTIEETVASILGQKYPQESMEMIVVDGCSEDGTLAIIANKVSGTRIQSRIYSDEGKGLGAARQIVVERARGKYIVYVDSDVVLSENLVQEQVEFFERHQEVGLVVGRCLHKEGPLVARLNSLIDYAALSELSDENPNLGAGDFGPFSLGVMCYRVRALRQAEGFDEYMKGASEDKDVAARIQGMGWRLSVNQNATFYHNSRESWKGLWNERKWFGYGGHYLYHKHGGLYPLWRNIPLVSFVGGLGLSSRAYRLVCQKIAFLLPVYLALGKIAWWYGFSRSNAEGYGHGMRTSQ